MISIRPIAIFALFVNCIHATASECPAHAEKQNLSGKAKQQFIQACQAKQSPHAAARESTPSQSSSSEGIQAGCSQPDQCDFSTQLEASAAGLSGNTRANSGHSFVRLKRISN